MTPRIPRITPELVKSDAQLRIARTAGQGGVAGSIVIVGEWLAHEVGWHGDLPTAVSAAMVVILTTIGARVANRRRLRGEV